MSLFNSYQLSNVFSNPCFHRMNFSLCKQGSILLPFYLEGIRIELLEEAPPEQVFLNMGLMEFEEESEM